MYTIYIVSKRKLVFKHEIIQLLNKYSKCEQFQLRYMTLVKFGFIILTVDSGYHIPT